MHVLFGSQEHKVFDFVKPVTASTVRVNAKCIVRSETVISKTVRPRLCVEGGECVCVWRVCVEGVWCVCVCV